MKKRFTFFGITPVGWLSILLIAFVFYLWLTGTNSEYDGYPGKPWHLP